MKNSALISRGQVSASAAPRAEMRWSQTAVSSQEVLPADFSTQVSGRFPGWLAGVVERVEELGQRGQGWDSYDGDPLSEDAANALLEVLFKLASCIQTEPMISLTSEGGLIAEWESSQAALELVATGSKVHVYYSEEASQREWEMAAVECVPLDKWLWRASSAM
jgi:hypothetical protein